jgi:hypothetical protein
MGQIVSEVENILNYKKEKKAAESERQKVLAQIAADETAKTNLVKKALARQRAAFGAGGMTGKGMTEEAVLRRLRSETEEPFNEKRAANADKLAKIKRPKLNLLKSLISKFDGLL